eukprot:gene346-373_t
MTQSRLLRGCFLALIVVCCRASYWHVYDPEKVQKNSPETCQKYEVSTKPLTKLAEEYQLWPNVSIASNSPPSPNSVIYGFEYTIDYIWKHQHPPKENCANLKFVINGLHNGGFGSELHVHGGVLGMAINLERTFLWNPVVHNAVGWEFDTPFCDEKRNFECYYQPASSCTVFDALGPNALNILRQASQVTRNGPFNKDLYIQAIGEEDCGGIEKDTTTREEFIKKFNNYKIIYIRNPGWVKYCGLPYQLLPLIKCSPMTSKLSYYWWRAISMTYLLRPNKKVQEWINKHRLTEFEKSLHQVENDFISLYIRRGDKSIEMRLPDLSEYTHAVQIIHKEKIINDNNPFKVIFLASEDSKVIKSMKEWNGHHSKYLMYWTEVFDRKGLLAERSEAERKQFNNHPAHHPEEYLSMLLNIHYLMQGSVHICTLASNFCRLIDELRATVGGRADKTYIDLSVETCGQPPCINGNITQLYWR